MRTRLRAFAVEDTSVQLTWRRLGPGRVVLREGEREVVVDTGGGPGAVVLDGLAADREHEVRVTAPGLPGDGRTLAVRTLGPPPGRELFRFGTISDIHLGEDRFGFLKTMKEKPEPAEAHPVRCTRAALAEMKAWGAEAVVVKGDITEAGQRSEFATFGALVEEAGLPVDALPGNHEARARREIDPDDALVELGLKPLDGVRFVDRPGIRLVLVDSTLPGNHHRGTLTKVADAAVEAVADAPGPAMVLMHHNVRALVVPHFWPPGVSPREGRPFFDRLLEANPATIVTSGHTHRHRRTDHGPLPVTEVGSPKDHPGTWAGYVVHEGGIRQVVRRVAAPDCIAWTEHSRWAAGGVWGLWSPGRLTDRCFTHPWP